MRCSFKKQKKIFVKSYWNIEDGTLLYARKLSEDERITELAKSKQQFFDFEFREDDDDDGLDEIAAAESTVAAETARESLETDERFAAAEAAEPDSELGSRILERDEESSTNSELVHCTCSFFMYCMPRFNRTI